MRKPHTNENTVQFGVLVKKNWQICWILQRFIFSVTTSFFMTFINNQDASLEISDVPIFNLQSLWWRRIYYILCMHLWFLSRIQYWIDVDGYFATEALNKFETTIYSQSLPWCVHYMQCSGASVPEIKRQSQKKCNIHDDKRSYENTGRRERRTNRQRESERDDRQKRLRTVIFNDKMQLHILLLVIN